VEYVNPHPYTVQVSGPNKECIRVNKFTKVVLSDWFIDRFTPKFLRVVRILSDSGQLPIMPGAIQAQQPAVRVLGKTKQAAIKRIERIDACAKLGARNGVRSGRGAARRRERIVGKALARAGEIYNQAVQDVTIAVSNNIGIGILSYNRLDSLQRLVNSIRKYTDLSRTTVFVSDDGSDKSIKEWLSHQSDIIAVNNQERIGIAGNSNRLLRCLARFKYKILLNDDVEITGSGWDQFYVNAIQRTGYHHFCYRQPGLYGATEHDGKETKTGGLTVLTIQEKPHGAVMAFDDVAFDRVGYFDESLEQYGMEHVDWSNRVTLAGLQPIGFHDIMGSHQYFIIHKEKSALVTKGQYLRENRAKYEGMKSNKSRLFVHPTSKSAVPSVAVIVPIRDVGRSASVKTVLNNIRAQRFPEIELILVEQDFTKKSDIDNLAPVKYMFVKSSSPIQEFNKSRAFNNAMLKVSSNNVILHDADIIVQADYIKKISHILQEFEGCHVGSRVVYLNQASSSSLCQSGKLEKTYTCERAVGYFEGGSIAFRKLAYYKIGGFNEVYEGYGCEDCDFFERLRDNTKFFNERSIDMFHIWHSRVPGWTERHRINKRLADNINKTMSDKVYVAQLRTQMMNKYPESKAFYG
jgi:GT2 family glycosyltransferase